MNRPHIGKHMEKYCMARFMISGNLFILFRNNLALLLSANPDLDKCLLNVCLHQELPSVFGGINGGFVHQVLQIGTGESGCRLGYTVQIHILAQRFILRVDTEYLLASLHIWPADRHLPVKPARTQNRRIQDIHTVGSCHDNDSLINSKAVHLYEQLIQRLLPLIMASAHTGSPLAGHGINLIDKYDTGGILFGILEQITDT